jgi:hypothetical protein
MKLAQLVLFYNILKDASNEKFLYICSLNHTTLQQLLNLNIEDFDLHYLVIVSNACNFFPLDFSIRGLHSRTFEGIVSGRCSILSD